MLDNLKRVPAISLLVAAAVMVISPIAHAEPVHMSCSGAKLLPNRRVENSVLSLTIDLGAKTVTVGGYQPLVVMPAIPASPGIPNTENNQVSFIGKTILGGVLSGNVDRITGEANITFQANTPEEEFFSGICRPSQKLF
jgi:hypothetical protein